jgi:hypothetical protein
VVLCRDDIKRDWLFYQYITLEKSISIIANELNCSRSLVHNRLIDFDIPRRSISDSIKGAKNGFYGKRHSDETKYKMSLQRRGKVFSQEHIKKLSISHTGKRNGFYGKHHTEETIEKIRNAQLREKSHAWLGGRSIKYCEKFTPSIKNEIRNKYNNKCYICGSDGGNRKLSVHHIDYNKNAICNGKMWGLIPLCGSCHIRTNHNRWHWFNLLNNYWLDAYDIWFSNIGGYL